MERKRWNRNICFDTLVTDADIPDIVLIVAIDEYCIAREFTPVRKFPCISPPSRRTMSYRYVVRENFAKNSHRNWQTLLYTAYVIRSARSGPWSNCATAITILVSKLTTFHDLYIDYSRRYLFTLASWQRAVNQIPATRRSGIVRLCVVFFGAHPVRRRAAGAVMRETHSHFLG